MRTIVRVCGAAFFLTLLLGPGLAAARSLHLPDAFTPVLVGFVGGDTFPVKGSDGRWHVVYELWLTNAGAVPASVNLIEVLDYDPYERLLVTLEGETQMAPLPD